MAAGRQVERVGGRRVNLTPSQWQALRAKAFREQTTVSEQVRRAVALYLRRDVAQSLARGGKKRS